MISLWSRLYVKWKFFILVSVIFIIAAIISFLIDYVFAIRKLSSEPLISLFYLVELLSSVVALFLFAGLSLFVVRYFLGQFDSLRAAASEIQQGNLDARASIIYQDEIGFISKTFNSMAEHLKRRIESLYLVNKGSYIVGSQLSVDEMLEKFVDLVGDLLNAPMVVALMINETTDELFAAKQKGINITVSIPADHPTGIAARAFREQKPILYSDITKAEELKASPLYDSVFRAGAKSILGFPIVSRNRSLGALLAMWPEVRLFSKEEETLLSTLASQTANSLEKARLIQGLEQAFKTQKSIADTLQSSLITGIPSELTGFDVSVAYISATKEAQIGGDLYDIFQIDDQNIGIVIGDISGKGIQAATYTAMSKYSLKALALEGLEPREAVTSLNRIVSKHIPPDKFITLIFGVYNTAENRFTYCNAGHPPPIIIKSGEFFESETKINPAVGPFPETEFNQGDVDLSEGDLFFMYTDGLTEARLDWEFFGVERLKQILVEVKRQNSKVIRDAILNSCLAFSGGKLNDDLALIVWKIT